MDAFLQVFFSQIAWWHYLLAVSVIIIGVVDTIWILFSSDLESRKFSLVNTALMLAITGGYLFLSFRYIENPLSEGVYKVVYESQTNVPKERWVVVEGGEKELHLIKVKNDSLPPQTKEFIRTKSKFYSPLSFTEAARANQPQ